MRKGALKVVPVIAVIGLLVLALVPASASANPASGSISFAGNATLLSNPGPADVTLHYSCLAPSPGVVQAALDENGVTGLSPVVPATCDGQNHSVTVTVSGLFTPGTAAGIAEVVSGNFFIVALTQQRVAIK
jgi:hypothetical protein